MLKQIYFSIISDLLNFNAHIDLETSYIAQKYLKKCGIEISGKKIFPLDYNGSCEKDKLQAEFKKIWYYLYRASNR